jgi:hypothetical protein
MACNDAGWIVRVRRRCHRICWRWVRRKARRRSSQTNSPAPFAGHSLPPPSHVQHGENFLSFAFSSDPAQLAQVFERTVQRELVRCDFGKPVPGVHWSHRLAPENVRWLAPLFARKLHPVPSITSEFVAETDRVHSRGFHVALRFAHAVRIRSENVRTNSGRLPR